MNYSTGVEYGYSLPVAYRLNIDFTIAVGYWGGTYYEYTPVDNCYVWQATKERHWFGPTKAEISLVWLIGRETSIKGKEADDENRNTNDCLRTAGHDSFFMRAQGTLFPSSACGYGQSGF